MADSFGRTKITTDVDEITSENILQVLSRANGTFEANLADMENLWAYYTGEQAIQGRTKEVREDILNIITENRCKEITDFKVGYRCEGPVVYVARKQDYNEQVNRLNDYLLAEGRASKDRTTYFYQSVFGTAYKMALADSEIIEHTGRLEFDADEAPFELFAVDPRKAFVIYSTGIGEKPMAGVYRVVPNTGAPRFTVYTEKEYFKIANSEVVERGVNGYGMIPIVEYPNNEARLGDFEAILSLQDALNTIDSNRLDGIEQFIQSLIILTNCDLPEGTTAAKLMQTGILKVRSNSELQANVKILAEQLDQSQTQTLKEDLKSAIVEISAMPNRSTNAASGDTGLAVMYRNGWNAAEAAAQSSEIIYRESELELLKVILKICTDLNALSLNQSAVDVKFTRRNHWDMESKVNVFTKMLDNAKVDPKLAYIYSDLFADPEEAYAQSLPYIERALEMEDTAKADSSQRSE